MVEARKEAEQVVSIETEGRPTYFWAAGTEYFGTWSKTLSKI